MQYFVVMIDYGRRGREAIVDPEITRREVVSRVVSGEYRDISFIHEIADSAVEDVTAEIWNGWNFASMPRSETKRPTSEETKPVPPLMPVVAEAVIVMAVAVVGLSSIAKR